MMLYTHKHTYKYKSIIWYYYGIVYGTGGVVY